MQTAGYETAFSAPSIVAWFALLVVVFAVFVILGLCQSLREPAPDDEAPKRPPSAPGRGARSHRKE